MNKTTKKQHYIWRSYLAPWTSNHSNTGQIFCLRNAIIFSTSLMNIAHENYFYGVKELSNMERELVQKMTSEKMHGIQRIISEEWLNLFCAPYDLADRIAFNNCSLLDGNCNNDIKNSQEFADWTVEFVERLHSRIESTGIQYISSLRDNDLNFWKEESERDKFSFFVSNQYLRTKKAETQ